MGTKNDPGAFDCYANAAPDEPMFVLLARDKHAPALVRLWARLRIFDGEDAAKVREAFDCAAAMEAYRRQLDRDAAPVGEVLGALISTDIARQLGDDLVDNLGDGESILLMADDPAINLVELAEALIGPEKLAGVAP